AMIFITEGRDHVLNGTNARKRRQHSFTHSRPSGSSPENRTIGFIKQGNCCLWLIKARHAKTERSTNARD
ncbi:hypothetical protein, partial [Mesorhizobium sp.]|uniref:hypothetical protein n=1 Tax=Mesorhizobium sp. TaxID=1871066 RepID=UPI0025C70EEF